MYGCEIRLPQWSRDFLIRLNTVLSNWLMFVPVISLSKLGVLSQKVSLFNIKELNVRLFSPFVPCLGSSSISFIVNTGLRLIRQIIFKVLAFRDSNIELQ